MKRLNPAKLLSGLVYGAGVLTVLCLLVLWAAQSQFVPFPDAMLPSTLSELAFGWLALGTLPMLLACFALYRCWGLADSQHPRRSLCLVLLPGLLCALCLLVILSTWMAGSLVYTFLA